MTIRSVGPSCSVQTDRQTDRMTDMTKLTVVFIISQTYLKVKEPATFVLCDCDDVALATLCHIGLPFLEPSGFQKATLSKV